MVCDPTKLNGRAIVSLALTDTDNVIDPDGGIGGFGGVQSVYGGDAIILLKCGKFQRIQFIADPEKQLAAVVTCFTLHPDKF